MEAMQTVQDLIEEAKVRTLYWALCIFAVTYFLTNTSKSMWLNFPIALLLVSALRVLLNNVEFHLKVHHPYRRQTYLSYLMKKQLSIHDSRLSVTIVPPRWKRKIGSPIVEAAVHELVSKILQDFVIDLWYSDITPDKDAPELIRAIILDALGEVAGRVKELNLIDLLTRDVINLVGDHLDLYRRNQLVIGADVMKILSTEEKDERLKHHLLNSRELHPALISPECEYKVLQKLAAGVLSVVLRAKEAQCSLVRCIARELITCIVLQPIMDFASPAYINEVIERLLETKVNWCTEDSGNSTETVDRSHTSRETNYQETHKTLTNTNNQRVAQSIGLSDSLPPIVHKKSLHGHPAHWARVLNATTQRRTEVLMPENLENMWSRGRSYKKAQKSIKADGHNLEITSRMSRSSIEKDHTEKSMSNELKSSNMPEDKIGKGSTHLSGDLNNETSFGKNTWPGEINESKIRRSNSTSALRVTANTNIEFDADGDINIIKEFYSPEHGIDSNPSITSNIMTSSASYRVASIKCRVIGAYFEKIGSKSFAVYSIAVTDAEHKTWFVKRRYSNFERLHRHLKDIPNYTLHLPPKRIFSSSTEDAFVHQRCIQLDKYLQDLLSITNVAEQHEVWDFLSASSKNYSFGKSSSVMRTLAVNVDDAMDDIVRQFKGASGGFVRKVVASSHIEPEPSISGRNLSWNTGDINKNPSNYNTTLDSANSISDNEDGNGDEIGQKETESGSKASGWHSDNELHLKDLPPRIVRGNLDSRIHGCRSACFPNSDQMEGSVAVPPEWMPPNVSVPLLNLVDKVFQLKRRGWLRRQVFWISKQILQLVMEDAIDDFLLRQIHWIRNEDVIAQGIRWVQDALWPDGVFYLRSEKYDPQHGLALGSLSRGKFSAVGSFETQLEASRRANYIKKMIFNGAPATLVSLIGHKQYKRCANDIYYFMQSNICLKQLAYGILELALVSVFPELHDLITDIHENMRAQPE